MQGFDLSSKAEADRRQGGFTLVELLVVIAIIGILVALLLPAVQAAREAARRMQCGNQEKQIALAILNYESVENALPPGAFLKEGSAWSAYILPYLEEGAAFDNLVIGEDDGGNFQWAHQGEYSDYRDLGPTYANIGLVETVIGVYRCPSAGLLEHHTDISTVGWYVMERVPASYLGVASGLAQAQFPDGWLMADKRPAFLPTYEGADGSIIGIHKERDAAELAALPPSVIPVDGKAGRVALRKVTDGTSKTVMIGEALHDTETQELNGADPSNLEQPEGSRKDHWFGGSDDLDTSISGGFRDISEFLGSTGVPPNLGRDPVQNRNDCVSARKPECQALQLSFGSNHPGVVLMGFVDGHVETIQEDVDEQVWSDLGSRASQRIDYGGGTLL